ncbi:hypothetical protein OEB99_05885 [Actinotalea sp. M2MS4P-6]|uniref:YtxH domain-containing protein n=1 Tax=Actinotalea sp. M2MS4P-6 TaxID=2983762 RepID=UPI0021E4FEE6|nr:YtxH domain-containing protein [Actinotalea sp. M2MS4P-6]MCV2393832.1 hypothetical protein [Actinotalea sp. M2MS4P-6]
MRAKAAFVLGGVVGYVLGTRAGREQFERISDQARRVWEDPKVQEAISDATQRASAYLQEKAPDLQATISEAVRKAR